MFCNKSNSLFFTLLSIFVQVQCLMELQKNENIDLTSTETAIRDTFNMLFSTLKIRNVQNKPRLKEFSTIHNFFISITLKDCDNLKEIEWLSRVNDIDNNTYFITEINEVLDGQDESDDLIDNTNVMMYIETLIKKLRYFKDYYKLHNNLCNLEINPEILQHLNDDEIFENSTNEISDIKVFDDNILQDIDVFGQNGRRLYKGISGYIEMFPYMASIHIYNKYRCGGSIISMDLIITSSTCLQLVYKLGYFRATPDFFSVRVGSTYTRSGGEKIGVHAIHLHPHFNSRTLDNNLGLVRLNRKISISWAKSVRMIDYDKGPTKIGRNILVVGWGAKDNRKIKSKRLSYAVLDRLPLRYCKKVYSKKYVKDSHFCAGFASKKGGACKYDIGDPGIVDGKISGIINFGSKDCGARGLPTVFTKVGYHSGWIRGIMWQMPTYLITNNFLKTAHNYSELDPESVTSIAGTEEFQQPVKGYNSYNYPDILNDFTDFISNIFVNRANDDSSNNSE